MEIFKQFDYFGENVMISVLLTLSAVGKFGHTVSKSGIPSKWEQFQEILYFLILEEFETQ